MPDFKNKVYVDDAHCVDESILAILVDAVWPIGDMEKDMEKDMEEDNCAFLYKWQSGIPLKLPCFWIKDEHPKKSGHVWIKKDKCND